MSHVILQFFESSLTPGTRRPDGVMNVSHVRLHVHFGTKRILLTLPPPLGIPNHPPSSVHTIPIIPGEDVSCGSSAL